eukprot:403360857
MHSKNQSKSLNMNDKKQSPKISSLRVQDSPPLTRNENKDQDYISQMSQKSQASSLSVNQPQYNQNKQNSHEMQQHSALGGKNENNSNYNNHDTPHQPNDLQANQDSISYRVEQQSDYEGGSINIVSQKAIPPPIQMIKQNSVESDLSGADDLNMDMGDIEDKDGRYTINSINMNNIAGQDLIGGSQKDGKITKRSRDAENTPGHIFDQTQKTAFEKNYESHRQLINVEMVDQENNELQRKLRNPSNTVGISPSKKLKMQRDSVILKQKKERDSQASDVQFILLSPQNEDYSIFQRISISSSADANDDIDEQPSSKSSSKNTNSNQDQSVIRDSYNLLQNVLKDNRFLVRQINFNLISSLKSGRERARSSFISRASNRLSKVNSSGSSSIPIIDAVERSSNYCRPRKSKIFASIFSCCSNPYQYNESISKNDNNSSVSFGPGEQYQYVLVKKPESFVVNTKYKYSVATNSNDNSLQINDEQQPQQEEQKENNQPRDFVLIEDDNLEQDNRISYKLDSQSNQKDQVSKDERKQKLNNLITKVPQNQQQTPNQNILIQNNNSNSSQQILQQNELIPNFEIDLDSLEDENDQMKAENQNNRHSEIQEQNQDIHQLHFLQTIAALKNIGNITMPDISEIQRYMIDLPAFDDPKKRKTLIFDMDETLIHCVDDIENENPDVIIPIHFDDEDEPVEAGINIRPYLYECITEARKHFQVGVFTASHKTYANAILDYIDPENNLFDFRFYRDSCVYTREGYYVKDLRIFRNRDLKDLVIVDNSIYAFAFHIDNGVPIISYYNNKTQDEELQHMIYYIQCLAEVEDVRDLNREAFELSKLRSQNEIYQDQMYPDNYEGEEDQYHQNQEEDNLPFEQKQASLERIDEEINQPPQFDEEEYKSSQLDMGNGVYYIDQSQLYSHSQSQKQLHYQSEQHQNSSASRNNPDNINSSVQAYYKMNANSIKTSMHQQEQNYQQFNNYDQDDDSLTEFNINKHSQYLDSDRQRTIIEMNGSIQDQDYQDQIRQFNQSVESQRQNRPLETSLDDEDIEINPQNEDSFLTQDSKISQVKAAHDFNNQQNYDQMGGGDMLTQLRVNSQLDLNLKTDLNSRPSIIN